MKIGNLTIDGKLFLAPLAGISNRPFRQLARRFGASFCYTEMISSDAVVRGQEKTIRMIDAEPDEHPYGVQLFGSTAEYVAGSIKQIMEYKPDLIDINFGCPVRKVVRKNGGAALLKNLPLAEEIMRAAVENSPIPVTIKIRTGWETGHDIYLELGKIAEKCGIAAVTLHARSRTQNYGDKADWSKIRLLKEELSIPVIGNGDIFGPEDAARMLEETACDAIMIGRAAMKNLYVFRLIKSYLDENKLLPENNVAERIELALEHARLMVQQFGEKSGSLKMRKHLSWYSKGFRAGADLRRQLKNVNSYADINKLLTDYLKTTTSFENN